MVPELYWNIHGNATGDKMGIFMDDAAASAAASSIENSRGAVHA
jgi:hypothetical protein